METLIDLQPTLFVIRSDRKIVNITGSSDDMVCRVIPYLFPAREYEPKRDMKLFDIFLTLKRDASKGPVKALVMCYYKVEEIIFYPDVEVLFTCMRSEVLQPSYSIRILYFDDRAFNNNFDLKSRCIFGDRHTTKKTNLFKIQVYRNKYRITSSITTNVFIIYSCDSIDKSVDVVESRLAASVAKDVTPVDISKSNRYIHLIYFEEKPKDMSYDDSSRSLCHHSLGRKCVICLQNEADHMISPCNHVCACGSCQRFISEKCPVCRGQLFYMLRVFFP